MSNPSKEFYREANYFDDFKEAFDCASISRDGQSVIIVCQPSGMAATSSFIVLTEEMEETRVSMGSHAYGMVRHLNSDTALVFEGSTIEISCRVKLAVGNVRVSRTAPAIFVSGVSS